MCKSCFVNQNTEFYSKDSKVHLDQVNSQLTTDSPVIHFYYDHVTKILSCDWLGRIDLCETYNEINMGLINLCKRGIVPFLCIEDAWNLLEIYLVNSQMV